MEKKYYYIDSRGTQFGPLTLDELLGAGITPTTYVWRAGMKEWKMAKDVLEIAEQMQTPPMAGAPQPAYNNQYGNQYGGYNQSYDNEPIPSSYLGWSIAATLLCCLPAGIVAIIYASQVSSKWASGDREGARRSASLAKTWFWVSVGVGLCFNLLWVILYFVGVASAIGLSTLSYAI